MTTFSKYIALIDDVYKNASLTSILDGTELANALTQAGEFKVPKLSMDGLGDYSRSNGYVDGAVTIAYETKTADYDRGRAFSVDAMDDEETAGIAFGKLSSEFIRTKVAPELDAYRFAKYSAKAGTKSNGNTYTTGADVLSALITGANTMDEAEVPAEERVLFITPTLFNLIMGVDTTKSKAVLDTFAQVIKVPQARFYTAIDLYDGTTSGETAGGYIKDASSGKDINFLIAHKPATMQYMKHNVDKIITPELNQTADAWKFFYRAYAICDAYDNKTNGIYLNSK